MPRVRLPSRRAFRAAATFLLAATASAADHTPPAQVLRVAIDEPLTVRFGRPVRASRVGSQSMQIVAQGTNAPARGQYVPGTFLRDKTSGVTEIVDPDAYRLLVQASMGLDREAARRYVERVLTRHESTAGRVGLDHLIDSNFNSVLWQPRLDREDGRALIPSQQQAASSETLRALRLLTAGDDDLWAAHIAGDTTAFAKLAADPRFERFWHAPDPVTGLPNSESEMRRHEHRRVLFDRRPMTRTLTFVPDVPQATFDVGAGLAPNSRYHVRLSGPLPGPLSLRSTLGDALAIHRRTATFDTTDPAHQDYVLLFQLSEYAPVGNRDAPRGAPRVVDVTPPAGETLVDGSTDWEDPDDRHQVALADRRPFVVRLRFNEPLDPASVSPSTFTLTCAAVAVATPNEYQVNFPLPCRTTLRQTRLGAVEVEVRPAEPLEPQARYEVGVRNLVASLAGRTNAVDFGASFTTAPTFEDAPPVVGLDEDFTNTGNWHETNTLTPRTLSSADAARDPTGRGLFVPFLGDDPVPVSTIESDWFDSGTLLPHYTLVFQDPAAPALGGTSIHTPPGASVRVLIDAAPENTAQLGSPQLFLETGWVELSQTSPTFDLGRRYFRLRLEFTLPPGATPSMPDLPYVDTLTIRAERR